MLSKSNYGNPRKNTSSTNSLYSKYWDDQAQIRRDILKSSSDAEKYNISELDQYKRAEIKKVEDEVKEYERTHGNSGNFFADFKYGVSSANNKFMKPFNKYVSPVISKMGPVGASIATSTNYTSGIVDKLV